MFRPFDQKLLVYQFRYLYLFIPVLLYFVMLIFYPVIESTIYGRKYLQNECHVRNIVISIDEYFFSWFYYIIDRSFNMFLLVMFAIPYLLHFINPVLYLTYLIYKRPGYAYFWRFVLSFGLTCSFSIILESSYPTAPPWYYLGLPNEGKFYLVDNLFNIQVFHTLYGLNKLICGAFPSLHVSWPTVIAMNGVVHPFFGMTYVMLIASAAVYSRHHWIIDVTFGFLIATTMSFISKWVIDRLYEPELR